MTKYVILQCPNPQCNFRFPAETESYGIYCPLCGEQLQVNEYLLDYGYAHFENKSNIHLECALDNVRSSYNVGSIFRSASAFSVKYLYLCGFTPSPDQLKVRKTSLGAEKLVPWSHELNAIPLIQQKKAARYRIYSIEASLTATSLLQYAPDTFSDKVLLVLGNEVFGIDPEIRQLSDAVLQIPVFGEKKSLNVVTAFSIAVFYFSLLFK